MTTYSPTYIRDGFYVTTGQNSKQYFDNLAGLRDNDDMRNTESKRIPHERGVYSRALKARKVSSLQKAQSMIHIRENPQAQKPKLK